MSRPLSIALYLFLLTGFFMPLYAQDTQDSSPANEQLNIVDSWDFGRIKAGQVARHEFTLKNNTQKDMFIEDVNTSCGCTASKIHKKILHKGESTPLEVSFNSKGYSGEIKQYVFVVTRDAKLPLLRFLIKAEVVKANADIQGTQN